MYISTNKLQKKVFHKIRKEEKTALKEIRTSKNCCVRVQGKVSRFVIILNEQYYLKVHTQIERGFFITLPRDVTKGFNKKVNDFVLKWEILKDLDGEWIKYISYSHVKAGSMVRLKENKPERVTTSGFRTVIRFLSVFGEKYIYREVVK